MTAKAVIFFVDCKLTLIAKVIAGDWPERAIGYLNIKWIIAFTRLNNFLVFLFKEIYMLKSILKHAVVLSFALGSAAAFASTYTFTGVNANEVNVSNQLSLEVTQTGSSVDFKFINAAGGADVFVGAIYELGSI